MKNKLLKNSKLSQKILCSILAAGVLGMSGNVFANDLEIVDQTINYRAYGKDITATSSYGNITGNSVVYAPADGLAGGAAYISSYVSGSEVIVPTVTFNNSLVANNKAEATAGATYGSSAGGALFIKGSTAIFNDAVFTNNIAEAKGAFYAVGGAILADAKVNTGINQQTSIQFNNTKDTVYTGNNVISADSDNRWYDTYGGLTTTAGGFLFLDRSADATFNVTNGSTLTIGEANSENNMDTIASSLIHSPNVKTATIKKIGNGTLTINSDFNKYYGTITVEEGTVNLNKDLTVKNTFTVNSQGTLNLGNVTLDRLSNAVGGTNVNKEAGTFNLVGVNASNAGKTETYTLSDSVGSITTAAGSTLNAGNVVLKDGTSITAAGEVNISKGLMMEAGSKAELSGGGAVTAANGENTAVYANGSGTSFTSKNVDFTGAVSADNSAQVTINGGTITASNYYADGQLDGLTEINSSNGGTLTVNNTQINSHVAANGGTTVINNSNIASPDGIDVMNGGTLQLNGSADNTYTVTNYILVTDDTSKLEINGGKLIAENLRDLTSYTDAEGTVTSKDGGIVLQGKGVIETKADQIFANGVDVTSDETVLASTSSGDVTNDAISYVGGTLSLTDKKYSLGYVKSAKDSLRSHQKDSKTSIVMTGDLVTNGKINEITVGEAASVGDEIALDQVTATSANNLIVGVADAPKDSVEGISVETAVNNGFSVAVLDIKSKDGVNTNGVVITDGENVTLGGSADGELITVDGTDVTDASTLKVVVGTTSDVDGVMDNTGSLTIGNALATENTEYNLTGSVTVNDNSVLNVNGQTTVADGVTLNNAAVNVGNGTLVSNITAKGNVEITGSADIGELTVDEANGSSTVINVGSANATASTSISNANLNGAVIYFDPDWAQQAGTHGMAFESDTINGKVLIDRNNYVAVGTDDNTAAKAMFEKTGLTFGENDITAALYITGNQTLADGIGALGVDGSKAGSADFDTVKAGGFTAAANSVVMVDGQSIKDTAALSGVKDVTIDADAKLYVDGAKKGDTYKVLAGEGIDQGWANENIISDNALLVFTGDNTGNTKFDVTASYDKINNVYGDNAVVIDSVVDKTLEVGKEGEAAFDFFNAAANSNNNATKDAQIAAFNSAANMGELAGVNHGTYSMSNAMTDAVAHHLSLATHGEQDKDIWAHYIHNKEDIDGMELGGIEGSYDAQYNGIVVGSDLYKNGKTTAGIALSYADGNINGSNIASSTKNEAEYYGASLYGRIDNGDSAILGDISYMHSDNDITQNNSGHEITASADADAFSIGIRAEQAYKAGAGKFVPYAGIRYMHLGAGDYSNSLGMEYNADDQNLWLLPVGVTYSAEVQSGDWTVKPIAEVGYVWTMGDRDTDQTVSLNGASDTFGFETADSGSFIGRLGIEAEKADVTYGLSYEYQKGDTVKANKWMANLTWSF